MLVECGGRFANNLYMKASLDPEHGDATVTVEMIDNEGDTHIITGTVVWDE